MKLITVNDYNEMSAMSAGIIGEQVRNNPCSTLGLATGSTSLGTYARLCQMYERGEISFKLVKTVNLDEYVGLPATHKQSYAYFMRVNLFDFIDIELLNTFIPNGTARDLSEECKRYNDVLDGHPRDIQLLGLGSDGHIAFNEPYSPFDCRTRVVRLEESTVKDNSRLFDRIEDVPVSAISMGIADIMNAKKVVLLASGLNKAQAVRNMVRGEVDERCPASILQCHPDATVILDKQSASLL